MERVTSGTTSEDRDVPEMLSAGLGSAASTPSTASRTLARNSPVATQGPGRSLVRKSSFHAGGRIQAKPATYAYVPVSAPGKKRGVTPGYLGAGASWRSFAQFRGLAMKQITTGVLWWPGTCYVDLLRAYFDTTQSFVPAIVLEHLDDIENGGTFETTFGGLAMLADISGFTKLSERMCTLPQGADLLATAINTYFADMIHTIVAFGGDVYKFAGDALIVVWKGADVGTVANAVRCGMQLKDMVFDILAFSPDVAERFTGSAIGAGSVIRAQAAIAPLTLHCGLGMGDMLFAILGGVADKFEFIIDGPPLAEMASAEAAAAPGELVVSHAVWNVYHETDSECIADVLPPNVAGGRENVCIRHIQTAEGSGRNSAMFVRVATVKAMSHTRLEKQMTKFIPRSAYGMLTSQYHSHIASTRSVSVIFMSIIEPPVGDASRAAADRGTDTPHASLMRLQPVFSAIQGVINEHDAMLRQFLVDDKGIVVIAVLGTHAHAHLDDPSRAVAVAHGCYDVLREHSFDATMGVTTGEAFCGTVGCDSRMEYAVVGSVVNLAAKIMAGNKGTGVLIDKATKQALDVHHRTMDAGLQSMASAKDRQQRASFVQGPAIKVKGLDHPVETFICPITSFVSVAGSEESEREGRCGDDGKDGEAHDDEDCVDDVDHNAVFSLRDNARDNARERTRRTPVVQVVGRNTQMMTLRESVGTFLSTRNESGGVFSLVLSGQSGIGKTTLLHSTLAMLGAANVGVFAVKAYKNTRMVSCKTLWPIIDDLVGFTNGEFDSDVDECTHQRNVIEGLAAELDDYSTHDIYTIFKSLIGISWPDVWEKGEKGVKGGTRHARAHPVEVIAAILKLQLAKYREFAPPGKDRTKVALVIDDLQWADGSSIDVLNAVLNSLKNDSRYLVVMTSRPGKRFDQWSLLANDHEYVNKTHIFLGPMARGDVSEVLLHVMGSPPSEETVEKTLQITGGVPFWVDACARSIALAGPGNWVWGEEANDEGNGGRARAESAARAKVQHDEDTALGLASGAVFDYTLKRLNGLCKGVIASPHAVSFEAAVAFRTDAFLICITDHEGRTEYVNEAFCKASGYTAKELVGRKCSVLQEDGDQRNAKPNAELKRALRSRVATSVLLRQCSKEHNPYVVTLHVKPIARRTRADISADHVKKQGDTSEPLFLGILRTLEGDHDAAHRTQNTRPSSFLSMGEAESGRNVSIRGKMGVQGIGALSRFVVEPLDRQDWNAQSALKAAAAIGNEFTTAILSKLVETSMRAKLNSLLEGLERSNFIEQISEEVAESGSRSDSRHGSIVQGRLESGVFFGSSSFLGMGEGAGGGGATVEGFSFLTGSRRRPTLSRARTKGPRHAENIRWRFRHELMRLAIYGLTSQAQKQRWHRQIARAIENSHRDPSPYFVSIAGHYRAARDSEACMKALASAIHVSLVVGSMDEATTIIDLARDEATCVEDTDIIVAAIRACITAEENTVVIANAIIRRKTMEAAEVDDDSASSARDERETPGRTHAKMSRGDNAGGPSPTRGHRRSQILITVPQVKHQKDPLTRIKFMKLLEENVRKKDWTAVAGEFSGFRSFARRDFKTFLEKEAETKSAEGVKVKETSDEWRKRTFDGTGGSSSAPQSVRRIKKSSVCSLL